MLPILYSYRRCPYAMRARMALQYSGIELEHREIELKNKPQSMLLASPKGTVPSKRAGIGEFQNESKANHLGKVISREGEGMFEAKIRFKLEDNR